MWFKVGVQFVNPNGYVGKTYNFVAKAETLNFLSDKSARDTFVISSNGQKYNNSVIFTSIDEVSTDDDIRMYKEITSITIHPSVCLNKYPKECSAKFIMSNPKLFMQFIENYYLVTCENIEKKQITFAVPFNKFSCDKIYTNDFISIVEANAWSLEGKKLQVAKI